MYNGIATYFESGVDSADPVELVRMLYRGAIEAVEKARQHLREGNIAARSAELTRAGAILAHLAFSVKSDADPKLGRNLVELYDYMQRRLLRANLDQTDQPMAEVVRLLSTMLEAWTQCGPIESHAAAAQVEQEQAVEPERVVEYAGATSGWSSYGGGGYGEVAEEPVAEYAGQSWSF